MNTESAGQVTGMTLEQRRAAEEKIAAKREKARLAKQRQRAAKKGEPTEATVTPIRPEPTQNMTVPTFGTNQSGQVAGEEPKAAAAPASKDGEMACRVCGQTKAATKFPTKAAKDGAVSRDDRCRECRDASRKPRS